MVAVYKMATNRACAVDLSNERWMVIGSDKERERKVCIYTYVYIHVYEKRKERVLREFTWKRASRASSELVWIRTTRVIFAQSYCLARTFVYIRAHACLDFSRVTNSISKHTRIYVNIALVVLVLLFTRVII